MKNMRLLMICFALVAFSFGAFAQGKVTFEKTVHNFGDIKEQDGPAEITFEFTNTGNAPVTLTKVKASCGCTTPTWTKEAVAPGKTGVVKASYNPRNRPGKFNKTVTVNTDGTPNAIYLKINGKGGKERILPFGPTLRAL